MRRALTPLLAAALMLALAGCSAPEDTEPRYLPTPEGGVREYFPATSGQRTPLFIGMTYGQAKSAAEKVDLTVGEEDGADEGRNPTYDGWTVVAQDPAPGESTGRPWVRLTVLPNDEAEKLVAAALQNDPHIEEQRFTAEVTGYGDNPLALDVVQVDGALVQLDLIDPISESCDSSKVGEQAQAAKERIIPVGARVLVVMSERGDDHAFLHPWPTEVDPPLASMNEMLVRSGWWQPSVLFDGGFDTSSPTVASVPFAVNPHSTAPDTVRGRYAPHIAAAGSEGIEFRAGGFGVCQAIAEGAVDSYNAYSAELDRQIAAWEAEYQRRLASGYYSCIDGDGDGVCHER